MKLTIWTKAYRPFIFGGDVNAPIATMVNVGDPLDAGKGIMVHCVHSPAGRLFVCEATTGAIVGGSLEDVKKDILEGDVEVMKQQIEDAKERVKKAVHVTADEFWGSFT